VTTRVNHDLVFFCAFAHGPNGITFLMASRFAGADAELGMRVRKFDANSLNSSPSMPRQFSSAGRGGGIVGNSRWRGTGLCLHVFAFKDH